MILLSSTTLHSLKAKASYGAILIIPSYLDGDATGKNVSMRALSTDSRYIDESSLYNRYDDLNDYLCKTILPKDNSNDLTQSLRR